MSLFNRRTLLALPLALAACGFSPVYGPGSSGARLQNSVLVDAPGNRDAFLVTRRIEERLGRAGEPAAYTLALTVTTRSSGLAVDSGGSITRYNLLGRANYALRDTATGQIVTSGSVDNFTGFSTTGTTMATFAAQRDAQERLMTILADQVIARLLASTDLS